MHDKQYKFSIDAQLDEPAFGLGSFTYMVLKSDKKFSEYFSAIHRSRAVHYGVEGSCETMDLKWGNCDTFSEKEFAVMPQEQFELLVEKMNQLQVCNQEMAKNLADIEHDQRVMSKPSVQALLSKSIDEFFDEPESIETFTTHLNDDK